MTGAGSTQTPMMRQYKELKAKYPDAILFFRMGDFYEMFGDDAIKAAPILDVVLTSRDKTSDEKIPMCGIPWHSANSYIAKLIEHNLKVAICEQLEDPKLAKGIVKRGIVRIITPGTILEDNLLSSKENNYLACLAAASNRFGIALLDVSTGDFRATEIPNTPDPQAYKDELRRWPIRELLHPESFEPVGIDKTIRINALEDWIFTKDHAIERIREHFGVMHLDGFGLQESPAATLAVGALLDYLKSTQLAALKHISSLQTYHNDQFVFLDSASQRNLELSRTMMDNRREGSLLHFLDETCTAMGSRLLKQRLEQPLRDPNAVDQRLQEVDGFYSDGDFRSLVRNELEKIADLERLMGRITAKIATPRDLSALRFSLHRLPALKTIVSKSKNTRLQFLGEAIDPVDFVRDLLDRSIQDNPSATLKDGGVIRDGFNTELDGFRAAAKDGKKWIAQLQKQEMEATAIPSLKIRYNKLFGFFIEVTNTHLDKVPDRYIRRQTLVNSERFVTHELKEMEETILGAEEKMLALEAELFNEIRDSIAESVARVQQTARVIAELDVAATAAELAVTYRYRRPEIRAGNDLIIMGGRHPVVERMALDRGFVPNDTYLNGDENRLVILTGPNMAGKSTYIRQVALIVLMAQAGLYVPVDSAVIGTVDRIFTRVGASDNLAAGQSTFMVEMSEAANILNNATSQSLVILDEIGRGTSTFDGLSIAWAVAEYLHGVKCRTLFATHYHELTDLSERLDSVKNFNVVVKEWKDQVMFLRKVAPGAVDKSYGIQVARLAGLPAQVIERSKEVLAALELKESGRVPETGSAKKPRVIQPSLFMEADTPLLYALNTIDIQKLTPLDALNLLAKWKAEYGKGQK
ncbi:MAG: DNA mismatch repair protein MutS [bacterium]